MTEVTLAAPLDLSDQLGTQFTAVKKSEELTDLNVTIIDIDNQSLGATYVLVTEKIVAIADEYRNVWAKVADLNTGFDFDTIELFVEGKKIWVGPGDNSDQIIELEKSYNAEAAEKVVPDNLGGDESSSIGLNAKVIFGVAALALGLFIAHRQGWLPFGSKA